MRTIAIALAALAAPAAQAQTATSIVPDAAGSRFGTGTTAARSGTVTTIDGGTLAGTALFHSFASFLLASGDTARWTTTLTDPAAITLVVNRVTGGTPSMIDGRIDATALPNAGFYFINPAGVVFGSGAQVNVPGATWFASASSVHFADGQSFSAATPNGSTFSVAPVDSFGFLGNEGGLGLTGASAFTVAPGSLGLVGRDVTITGSQIGASALTLVAAGTASSVPTTGVAAATNLNGTIRIDASRIDACCNGGSIVAAADTLTAAGSTIVNRSGDLAVTARVITLTQGTSLATTSAGTGMAGDIGLTTSHLTLAGGATISSSAAAGAAGDITLTMPDEIGIVLLDSRGSPSAITTSSNSSMGGMIVISNPLAVISNGGAIRAQGQSGGANVLIASDYFIASADRMNQIAVDGAFHLDSNIYDVSNGTAVPSVAFVDASRVLSGQCASARSSGETSRLAVRTIGPLPGAPADPGMAPAGSGCR
jgi:filamentous hemagglutinin family protein